MMTGRHAAVWAAVFFLLAGAASAQAPDLSKMDIVERSTPDGPVAIVGGVSVGRDDFLRTYERHLAEVTRFAGQQKLGDKDRVRIGLTTLGELIRREILVGEAARRGLKVPEGEVDKAYAEKLKRFTEELKAAGQASATEQEVLKLAGQTREEARESIRRQLLEIEAARALQKERGASVTDKEVREFFDKRPEMFRQAGGVRVSQMLFRPKPSAQKADEAAWKAAQDLADRARARVMAGEKFEVVARDMSEASDAANGGDMGLVPMEQLPPFFAEVVRGMKPGDLSAAFRSEYGVHVLRLVETSDEKAVSFDDAKARIRQILEGMKTEEAVNDFIEPIVNDPDRTKIFVQLERTLRLLDADDSPAPAAPAAQPKEPAPSAGKGSKKGR